MPTSNSAADDLSGTDGYQARKTDEKHEDSRVCGCVGCREDMVAFIDHPRHGTRAVCDPRHGTRAVCEEHAAEYPRIGGDGE